MCFPVERADRERFEIMVGMLLPMPYTGAIQGLCASCNMRVWIGPRQQVMNVPATCVFCAVKQVEEAGAADVISLGNPEKVR